MGMGTRHKYKSQSLPATQHYRQHVGKRQNATERSVAPEDHVVYVHHGPVKSTPALTAYMNNVLQALKS